MTFSSRLTRSFAFLASAALTCLIVLSIEPIMGAAAGPSFLATVQAVLA